MFVEDGLLFDDDEEEEEEDVFLFGELISFIIFSRVKSLFSTSSYPPYPVDLSNSTKVRSIEIIDCQSNSFSCIRRQ